MPGTKTLKALYGLLFRSSIEALNENDDGSTESESQPNIILKQNSDSFNISTFSQESFAMQTDISSCNVESPFKLTSGNGKNVAASDGREIMSGGPSLIVDLLEGH